jgi:pyridoxamine 5'-phosphate oxidase
MPSGPAQRDLSALRREYERGGLGETDLTPDPLDLFGTWFEQARESGLPEPNAMVVTSVGAEGGPSSRLVLLKEVLDGGFCFYTNLESRKSRELLADPRCALLFPWHALQRQVRVEGTATRLPREQVEEYFASRPRGSQLGAWASPQSEEVSSRRALDAAYDDAAERFRDGPVPCPPHWGGFSVRAEVVEFWQGRSSRMHDRLVYRRDGSGGWRTARLAP